MVSNGPKIVPKLSQNSPKIVPKWSLNGPKMVLKLSQNSPKIFRVIDLEVINLNSEFEPCSSLNGWDKLLVQFLATMEAVAPLANDPIMLGRPIRSFRDLEHQNPSIISDSIDSARCGQIFSSNFGHQGVSGATCKWSHHVGEIDTVV